MSKFQVIVLGLFVAFLVAGVIAFATFKGKNTSADLPTITVWGTFPAQRFNQFVQRINSTAAQSVVIQYTEIPSSSFSDSFIAALARGQGPDAILVPVDMLLPHLDKVVPIPYTSFTQKEFKDAYIRQADLYLAQNGIVGIPFSVDPLIMYWNRDMFDAAGLPTYPRYWDDFSKVNQALTVKDSNGNIRKSAVALGQFANIDHARELLGTLFMQAGSNVTDYASDGFIGSALNPTRNPGLVAALEFFARAANPTDPDYSWNRSLPTSKAAFLSGMLATYFGFASELSDLREKNPNINFDAALIPQAKSGGVKATYGRLYGFSLVRSSANINAALQTIFALVSSANMKAYSEIYMMPSVRRDIIAAGFDNAYVESFNQASLVAKSWYDIESSRADAIFSSMIESVASGSKAPRSALQDADDQLDIALRSIQ